MVIARFSVAVLRRFKQDGQSDCDFINCVAFRTNAEFIEKYFRQGMRVLISGRIQTGSYTNRDGQKVYTTDVVVEEQEFADSKNLSSSSNNFVSQSEPKKSAGETIGDGFMNIPDGIDEECPFN